MKGKKIWTIFGMSIVLLCCLLFIQYLLAEHTKQVSSCISTVCGECSWGWQETLDTYNHTVSICVNPETKTGWMCSVSTLTCEDYANINGNKGNSSDFIQASSTDCPLAICGYCESGWLNAKEGSVPGNGGTLQEGSFVCIVHMIINGSPFDDYVLCDTTRANLATHPCLP